MPQIIEMFKGILTQLKYAKVPWDVIKKSIDGFLDPIENHIENTPNKIDDVVIGSAIKGLRSLLKIKEEPGSGFEDTGT